MSLHAPSGPSFCVELFGTPIFVNWSLPLLGAGIAYVPARNADASGVVCYLVAFICLVTLLVLHELGHAVLAKACSLKVRAIVLSGYGGCCVFEAPSRLWHAALVAAGGLMAQLLVLGIAVGMLAWAGASESPVVNSAVFVLVGANIAFMLLNIAPFRGSDGAALLAIASKALLRRLTRET